MMMMHYMYHNTNSTCSPLHIYNYPPLALKPNLIDQEAFCYQKTVQYINMDVLNIHFNINKEICEYGTWIFCINIQILVYFENSKVWIMKYISNSEVVWEYSNFPYMAYFSIVNQNSYKRQLDFLFTIMVTYMNMDNICSTNKLLSIIEESINGVNIHVPHLSLNSCLDILLVYS